MHSNPKTLKKIKASLEELGDLPIFSSSVNRISQVSANPDADAMQLSMEVMKDASLSVKLIRLVNSAHYNRSGNKIGAISQAVMILGFDTIKNVSLTLKLLDSFAGGDSELDMNNMLVHAYLSAAFMRELAVKGGVDDVEQSYMCGLLHNLGEIIVAYTLPDKYLQILQLMEEDSSKTWIQAQQLVLESTFDEVAKDLAIEWGFPSNVINSMGAHELEEGTTLKNRAQFNQVISSIADHIMASLYLRPLRTTKTFNELIDELSGIADIDNDAVKGALTKAFHMGCDLAKEYNLNKKLLAPKVIESGDAARDRVAKQFSYYARSVDTPSPKGEKGAAEAEVDVHEPGNKEMMLKVLGELTVMLTQKADLNVIFLKLLEGVRVGVGFNRVALCLLTSKRDRYIARLAMGKKSEQIKNYFQFPVDAKQDLFSKVALSGIQTHLVGDISEPRWRGQLPKNFMDRTEVDNFAIAAIGSDKVPLGFIYADMVDGEYPITTKQFDEFQQLVNHANLIFRMR